MATKRVTLNKSDGTSSYFDFTIPEEAGIYKMVFILDDVNTNHSQIINGLGILYALSGCYAYDYHINIGVGATNITISESTVENYPNTVNYNSSTGQVSGAIYSKTDSCSATLTWSGPTNLAAGIVTVGPTANTYELKFQLSDGTEVNAGTFTTPEAIIPEPELNHCLTFSSPSSFVLSIPNYYTEYGDIWDGVVEYSTDAKSWSEWNPSDSLSSGEDNKLYLRGTGNTDLVSNVAQETYTSFSLAGENISCTGDIATLLDYETVANGEQSPTYSSCFYRLFENCGKLVEAPTLSATVLSNYCYFKMFAGCSALNKAFDFTHVSSVANGALTNFAPSSCSLHFGKALTQSSVSSTPFDSSDAGTIYNLYFHSTDEEVSSEFQLGTFLGKGANKKTITNNVYTDSETLKTQALSAADSYTTVNVYKLDGGSWS